MSFHDFVTLIQAIVWPAVVVALAIVFHRELPKLVQALSGRISRFSVAGVTVELALAQPVTQALLVRLDEIREPTSTGAPPMSGVPSLLELAKASPSADYVVIDLRAGQAWLTSRLYLSAVVLPPVLALRCFVFVGTRGAVPRYFLGLASPESVIRALERRYAWLREAAFETQLQPVVSVVSGPGANCYVSWQPYGDAQTALQRLTRQASQTSPFQLPQAAALAEIVRALISPIDLSQPGQVEVFMNRFLQNPKLSRPHGSAPQADDWVHLPETDVDEHARWITDERRLLDLLGNQLHRYEVVLDQTLDDEAIVKAVVRKQGSFVAATDREGRFLRLIDRAALVEKIAAASSPGSTKG